MDQEIDFIEQQTDELLASIGGTLTADNMSTLSSDAITLIAYRMLRDAVMDGGFIGLIHNGLGPFIFFNPLAKAIREMGKGTEDEEVLHRLSTIINKGGKLFRKHGEVLTQDYTYDEFMALYEQYPQFDALDDEFVSDEDAYAAAIERAWNRLAAS